MGRQTTTTTGMDDVERQTPHGDTEILDKKTKAARDRRFLCISVIGSMVMTACIIFPLAYWGDDTHYYVAMDSASDLSPTEGLSFNLTLGVASRSYGSKACIEPGTLRVEVYYRGYQLAASESQVGRLCAGPKKSVEQRVAARATSVPLKPVMDRLAVDMNQGAAVFDIMLRLPPESYGVGEDYWVFGCKGSRLAAAAVWCDAPSQ